MTGHQVYPPLPTYLETAPRYTSLAAVKTALGIIDSGKDASITRSIVGIESMIDAHLGTSYPQDADPNVGTGDALDPPPIEGIPEQLKKAALVGSVAMVTLDDTPYGSAGSDEWFSAIEAPNAGNVFNSIKPMLIGLKRSWGLA